MVESYWCERCELYVEKQDVVRLDGLEGRFHVPTCPRCKSHVRLEQHEESRGIGALMLDAVRWPFSARAFVAVAALGIASFLLVQFASLFFVGPSITLAAFLTYGAATIRSTARGEDDPPYAVDLDGWPAVVAIIVRYQVIAFLALAPALTFAISEGVSVATMPVITMLTTVGLLYLPAALVVAAHANGFFSAIWPGSALRVAMRMGSGYLKIGAASAALGALSLGVIAALMGLGVIAAGIPFLPSVAIAFVVSAALLVNARFLGLVVREHRHDVGI